MSEASETTRCLLQIKGGRPRHWDLGAYKRCRISRVTEERPATVRTHPCRLRSRESFR